MYKDTGLTPRDCKSNTFPNWSEPLPIGYFSVDSERFYKRGHSNLRFFQPPEENEFPLDLNAGIDNANLKKENPMDEGIDHLLKFIIDNYNEIKPMLNRHGEFYKDQRRRQPLAPVEFVSWRGLLRTIMCTPSEHKNGWIINVTHYKGTFYFRQQETEEAKKGRLNETPIQKMMYSWGYKFEQYCASESPNAKPITNVPVDECAEFSCVYNTKVGGFNLLYGAEMDCIRNDPTLALDGDLPLDQLEFLELKTSLNMCYMNRAQTISHFRYKIRNWWCQSFLVGIRNIIVGWRDNNGYVGYIEEIPIKLLPKQSKDWSASDCAWFLISFLNCVKTLMTAVDCPHTVWEFQYNPSNGSISYKQFDGCTEKTFLPDYYVEFMEDLHKR